MTLVSPSLAQSAALISSSVESSGTPYALNTLSVMFDWSKGAAKKNSGRITITNLPKLDAKTATEVNIWQELAANDGFFGADPPTRAAALIEAASSNKSKVPELIAREAKFLNSVEFANLMLEVEEQGSVWSDSGRYFVFTYPSGSVGSIWLDGVEVYNSIWKNF